MEFQECHEEGCEAGVCHICDEPTGEPHFVVYYNGAPFGEAVCDGDAEALRVLEAFGVAALHAWLMYEMED